MSRTARQAGNSEPIVQSAAAATRIGAITATLGLNEIRWMHRADCESITTIVVQLAAAVKKGKSERITAQFDRLERALSALAINVVNQDRRARNFSPKYFEKLQQERGSVFAKKLRATDLRELLELNTLSPELRARLTALITRIDGLSSWRQTPASSHPDAIPAQ
jgi:hypothetical protein